MEEGWRKGPAGRDRGGGVQGLGAGACHVSSSTSSRCPFLKLGVLSAVAKSESCASLNNSGGAVCHGNAYPGWPISHQQRIDCAMCKNRVCSTPRGPSLPAARGQRGTSDRSAAQPAGAPRISRLAAGAGVPSPPAELAPWGSEAPPQGSRSLVNRAALCTLSRGMTSPTSPDRRPSRVVVTPSCRGTHRRGGGGHP